MKRLQGDRAIAQDINKLKSDFVTLASHEFRTPLTTILSSAHLLRQYASGPDKEKSLRHVTRITSAVNILTSILDDFLRLKKLDEGGLVPSIEYLNVKEFARGVCDQLGSTLRSGQRIEFMHSGTQFFPMDPVLLASIISSLISNASKYSPEGARIVVTVLITNTFVLSVKDFGIGIPQEDQAHLFTRFHRGSNVMHVQGTGLGLFLMQQYVNLMNGQVHVESACGKGTEVIVTFPGKKDVVSII